MSVTAQTQTPPALRKQTIDLLREGNAHLPLDTALENLNPDHRGAVVEGSPHTIWQLFEHLRIAQHDILEFSRDSQHVSPKWPDEYWPAERDPRDEKAWKDSLSRFRQDLAEFCDLVNDQRLDLLVPMAHAPDGQTLLREALVLADHNSYHLGQIVLLRKILEGRKAE